MSNSSSRKILVTGGAGFIGSHVVDACIAEGYEVVVVDNLSTGSRENLNPRAVFYEADISDAHEMERIFEHERPQVVNHHAAQMDVRKSLEDPVFDATTNILGSMNLILASVKYGTGNFIYISTGGAVYGEPRYLPVDEDHPINPEAPYGISKHTVEHYLHLYGLHYNLKSTILRYPNVYGPRQDPKGEAGVIAIFIGQMLEGTVPTIFGDGEQLRDYVYVGDIVRANLLALEKGETGIYNIGSGIGTSVKQLYSILSSQLSFREPPVFARPRTGEIQRIFLNGEKARRGLGWECEIPLAKGLALTVDWFKERIQVPSAAR
jgi:UDP-glucose 4-epimerase